MRQKNLLTTTALAATLFLGSYPSLSKGGPEIEENKSGETKNSSNSIPAAVPADINNNNSFFSDSEDLDRRIAYQLHALSLLGQEKDNLNHESKKEQLAELEEQEKALQAEIDSKKVSSNPASTIIDISDEEKTETAKFSRIGQIDQNYLLLWRNY